MAKLSTVFALGMFLFIGGTYAQPKETTTNYIPTIAPVYVYPSPEMIQKMKDNQKQLKCLTENIYHEAPYESYAGRLAVATVTMNRVKSGGFPSTVCGVVYQRSKYGCQFSWTCGKGIKARHPERYEKALTTAKAVLYKNVRDNELKGALYFHGTSVRPSWTNKFTPVKQIGVHIFYRTKK